MDLRVFINGVEYRATRSYTIREQVGQPGNTSIDVLLEDNPLPITHAKVELVYQSLLFYSGLITNVETPVFSSSFETEIVPINIISMETIFTRRLVSEAFENKFTHEIVESLFNDYLVEEGLTLGNIEVFERLYESYIVPNLRLSDVLQELGDNVGAVASITEDLVFNFQSKNSFPSVTPPTRITKLKKSESGRDLKTIQRVSGAKAETSIQTATVTWVANQRNILLGYQVAQEPSVTIDSISVEVGIIGIDEENPAKVFLWANGNNSLVLNNNATTQPIAGDTVSVIFKGYYNIDVVTENEDLKSEIAAISGTSGKIESIVVDTSIISPQDGETLGNNLLQEKSQREMTVTLECNDISKSSLLNTWELNYPELNISGAFVIVERTIRDFYDDVFKINLKMKNRSFYSRYGQSFNKYQKEINNLSIRTDDLVLKSSSVYETIEMKDEVESYQLFLEFTCGTTDIFSPLFIDGITPSGGGI